MKIGIIGAGPAGCFCASILSQAGAEVLLFDHCGAWEKPCGGGVTGKALRRYPFLEGSSEDRVEVRELRMLAPAGQALTVLLQQPLLIYPRQKLNQILLSGATANGTRFLQERVSDFESRNTSWRVRTDVTTHSVDFLVGADGVNSLVRRKLSRPFASEDLMLALGYRAPHDGSSAIEIKFFRGFPGYLWVFPRPQHLSIGVCGRLNKVETSNLEQRLRLHMKENGGRLGVEDVSGGMVSWQRYGAMVPSLRRSTLQTQVLAGRNWALVGDAGGFADPITGEGIYYALRSGELLAEALIAGSPGSYSRACREDFLENFVRAAEWFERFYAGRFLGFDFTTRMVQFVARSRTLQSVMKALVAGQQDYRTLKRSLVRHSPQVAVELVASVFS